MAKYPSLTLYSMSGLIGDFVPEFVLRECMEMLIHDMITLAQILILNHCVVDLPSGMGACCFISVFAKTLLDMCFLA